jgi:hypothetical protein
MNDIIFRCISNINIGDDIVYTENIEIEDIGEVSEAGETCETDEAGETYEAGETDETCETGEENEVIPLNIANDLGWEVREVREARDAREAREARDTSIYVGIRRCICRYNNFNLCDRNIGNNLLYCRYHKNTKIGYIHKIFYDVFKEKKEIAVGDLYMLYGYVNSNYGYIKELYIELLKNIPFKILLNIAERNHIISNARKYSKNEIYLRLYNINKNTHDLESNHINIEAFRKIHKIQKRLKDRLRDRIKNRIRDRLRNNILKLEDYESGVSRGDYMNSEELFTGENICDIPVNRLYVLNNSKDTKDSKDARYIFDAIELEYFVRKCRENKQEPYNPYNRDKLDEYVLENLYMFIKYNDLVIKNDEYLWENNMHAFTELSLEIESRGFYNSPEWFEKLKDADFLKVIKYFKLFSANTPESNKYFNEIRADTLIFDFCKDAIKMFKECNNEYYILCCNFMKSIALCSNDFYSNLPEWLSTYETTSYISTISNFSSFKVIYEFKLSFISVKEEGFSADIVLLEF